MRVFAVHDIRRAAILLYVDMGEQENGDRTYLTRPLDGEADQMGVSVRVAPGAEAPVYMVLPRHIAIQVGAAIESPLADEMVDLESWGDFAALVDRITGRDGGEALDAAATVPH